MNDETTYQLCKQAVSQVILVDKSLCIMYLLFGKIQDISIDIWKYPKISKGEIAHHTFWLSYLGLLIQNFQKGSLNWAKRFGYTEFFHLKVIGNYFVPDFQS